SAHGGDYSQIVLRPLKSCVFVTLCQPLDASDLVAFPTRRSADLPAAAETVGQRGGVGVLRHARRQALVAFEDVLRAGQAVLRQRSEEHTSELQSREKLVCRLLLEKKHEPQYSRNPRLASSARRQT